MPIIVVTGPRQSGKTTLVKELFPEYKYYNLEFPDIREIAKSDPRKFLENFEQGIIIDEIQYAPELFSYIQALSDEKKIYGKFILTGSQNFSLIESVSQSLAGRAAIFSLLPFSINELISKKSIINSTEYIFNGSYPPIYDRNLNPNIWIQSYIQTYLERDVRQIINIKDLSKFQLFLKLCAGRAGQLLNFNSLGNEVGIDSKTIKKWISILETSYIIFLLNPYFKNYNKRLIKTPKLYFYDTGILCQLLEIKSPEQIDSHYAKGSIFENLIIANFKKDFFNKGENKQLYFWRDSIGNEIDCLIESGNSLNIYEIKSSKTISTSYFKGLEYFKKISEETDISLNLVYSGDKEIIANDINIFPWYSRIV